MSRMRDTSMWHKVGPLILVCLGGYAVVAAFELSLGELVTPGPGLWPFLLAVALTVVAVVLLFIDDRKDYEAWSARSVRIAAGLVSLGVFILLFESIGFLISSTLMLVLWLRGFGQESWRWTVPLAVGGTAALHLVFVEALGVPFPPDVLTRLLGG